MIIKIGLLVAASIAVYAIQQISIKRWRTPSKSSEKDDAVRGQISDEDNKHHSIHPTHGLKEVVQGEEEVKLIGGIINQPFSNLSDTEDEISEFESLLSSEIDHPLPSDKSEKMKESIEERDRLYEKEMANNATELERLRNLVQELQEREAKLEGELLEYYSLKDQESEIIELQKQSKIKSVEIDMLNITINTLQAERKKLQAEAAQGVLARKELAIARNKIQEMQRKIQVEANQTKVQLLMLNQQVISLQVKEEEAMKYDSELEKKIKALKELEVEVVELKRINKELQHEKRELVVKLETAEAKIKPLSNVSQEVNSLRHANEDLQKQVEELQMNRFSEVEELVYLRWVNACLRYELDKYPTNEGKISARDLSKILSPRSQVKAKQLMLEYAGSELGQVDTDLDSKLSHRSSSFSEYSDNTSSDSPMSKYSGHSKNSILIQKLKKWGKSKDDSSILSSPVKSDEGGLSKRNSLSVRRRGPLKALMLMDTGKSVGFTGFGMPELDLTDSPESPRPLAEKYPDNKNRYKEKLNDIEKRAHRVPRPSPKLSVEASADLQCPQPALNGPHHPPPQAAMKADVENQGDFAKFLATEVQAASFDNMDDLVAFVNWLDEELHFLVDERDKHLDWPESKADALREAAFEYQDFVKLEKQMTSFVDDPSLPCEAALKKMTKLLEKVEQGICPLFRTRDMVISRYKEFGIPADWLLDSGLIGKIKLSTVQLARIFMKRVTSELDSLGGPDKEPNREYIALQGVRFTFRVHQFAGGFDVESMQAFEELRSRIGAQMGEDNKQETS